jgi:low affinity Fe/Cu permease
VPPPRQRSRLSRFFYAVNSLTGRAFTALVVTAAVVTWVVVAATKGFPQTWQVGFETAAAAITLLMVFSIQHTQRREQAVTQLKLDELLKALPETDERMVKVEASPDHEVHELHERQLEHHRAVRDSD